MQWLTDKAVLVICLGTESLRERDFLSQEMGYSVTYEYLEECPEH